MITTITKLEEKIGEVALVAFLDTFSCPLNPEVDDFLKHKALQDVDGNFYAPVSLIEQLGKNYAIDEGSRIPGKELFGMALNEFRSIKTHIGGKLVMVEREKDCPKLQTFYQKNGFRSWTSRINEDGDTCYDQMFAVI